MLCGIHEDCQAFYYDYESLACKEAHASVLIEASPGSDSIISPWVVASMPIKAATTTTTTTTTTITTTPTTDSTTTPSVCGIETDIGYEGNHVNLGYDHKQPDAESCRSFCESSTFEPQPSFFSWVGTSSHNNPNSQRNCWCKTALDPAKQYHKIGIFSGPIKCTTTTTTITTTTTTVTTSVTTTSTTTAATTGVTTGVLLYQCYFLRMCKNLAGRETYQWIYLNSPNTSLSPETPDAQHF